MSPTAIATESPLRITLFRRAWLSSVLTNIALLIQGVGVAWIMVEIATQEAMVAWVQAATNLPLMLLSIPAGAIADVFNRKTVAITGLSIALVAAFALFWVSALGQVTPEMLLLLCFLTGAGMALYDPAWQASVPSLVPAERLAQAIALRSISQNLARAFGPAIGGVLVAWQGGLAAFLCAALLYIPLIVVLSFWKYPNVPPRLPPERVDRAVVSGIRFVKNSPATRTVVVRGFLTGLLGIGLLALMPLAAKYRLQGGAIEYGIMLGAFGIGAVAGATCISRFRRLLSSERLVSTSMVAIGMGALAMALFPYFIVAILFLVFSGMGWLIVFSTLNINVQTSAPRWVMGRVVATYAAATTGGMVLGSLVWGEAVEALGIVYALTAVGICNMLACLTGIWLPFHDQIGPAQEVPDTPLSLPEGVRITHRSGPIAVEKEYRVKAEQARAYYRMMHEIERLRRRNGAYDWSLSRDITDGSVWIERFHLSTWLDYLRMSERATDRDQQLQGQIAALLQSGSEVLTRYRLERPMGSVRWQEEVVDNGVEQVTQISGH